MLIETQARLEQHFTSLSHERGPRGFPVYALEHGLSPAEIESIRKELCAKFGRVRSLERDHWLLWIVVAAEIGYTYDGDEYWSSFSTEIPDWVQFGDRDTVRSWFKDFAARFSGFIPHGRWAEHFSIIAWPITHSILPRYLQAHFARYLYEMRHELADKRVLSIDRLGELLSEHYTGHSSRFENFLQQTALTARLVIALRDEDVQGTVSPVDRHTLARIITDLESESSSRGYLRDARRVLRDARIRTTTGVGGLTARGPQSSSTASIAHAAKDIKLVARQASADSWTIGAALPDITALLRQTGVAVAQLDKWRMRFADKPAGWMPGRALLSYSKREHSLSALPAPITEPLIYFEGADRSALSLSEELKILTHPPWLLRVHADDVARQVLGNHIRTGEEYLIVTIDPVASEIAASLHLEQVQCRTAGIIAYRMVVPNAANPMFLQALAALRLGYALKAHVEPVGLVPRWDTSSASTVWLPGEDILLRIGADFDVSEYTVSVDSEPRTHISNDAQHELIISLGPLSLGRHVVEISATPRMSLRGATIVAAVAPETIFVEVRSPTPWQTGILSQAGFRTTLEPSNASVEDLVGKRAVISIQGPRERVASVEARLFDSRGHVNEISEIGRVALPASHHSLTEIIAKLTKEPLSEKLQSAPRIDLAFSVEELGISCFTFSQTVKPLRWKLEPHRQTYTMRLVDEGGVGQAVLVDRFDLCSPDKRVELGALQCFHGLAVEAPGALFVARHDNLRYAAIASVPSREPLNALSALGLHIQLATPEDSLRRIMRLLGLLRYWRNARALGPLAAIRKTQVTETVEQRIARMACGAAWADRAQRCGPGNSVMLDELQRHVGGSPGFASRMRSTHWTWHANGIKARAEFSRLAKFYGVSGDVDLCDLAFRLAFLPGSIRLTDPAKSAELFEQLGQHSTLVKGAYFAKLAADIEPRRSTNGYAGAQK